MGEAGVREVVGVDVPFDVVDGDEGDAEGGCDGFGGADSDEECSDEAGPVGDCDGVEVFEVYLGGVEGFADDGVYQLHVFAGGYFGYDSSVFGVQVYLGGDDVG